MYSNNRLAPRPFIVLLRSVAAKLVSAQEYFTSNIKKLFLIINAPNSPFFALSEKIFQSTIRPSEASWHVLPMNV